MHLSLIKVELCFDELFWLLISTWGIQFLDFFFETVSSHSRISKFSSQLISFHCKIILASGLLTIASDRSAKTALFIIRIGLGNSQI